MPEAIRPQIKPAIEATTSQMAAAGVQHKIIFLAPEEGPNKLKAELISSHPDGVVIGFGVRANANLTPFFEQLVNTVHEHAPQAKLLFNTRPSDTMDAVKRNFSI